MVTRKRKMNEKAEQLPVTSHLNTAINVVTDPTTNTATAMARTLTRPEVTAAAAIERWQKETHDVNELVSELSQQAKAVNAGDLQRVEAMLVSQAYVLDGVFGTLMRRVTTQENLKLWETTMRMAFKAQSQCRMTLEALAAIKNPPVVFAKQANFNHGGQQQVNNGTSRTLESAPPPNELIGAAHELRPNTSPAQSPIGAHPVLAAVGEVHRPEDT